MASKDMEVKVLLWVMIVQQYSAALGLGDRSDF
jgi:hypothetical protein